MSRPVAGGNLPAETVELRKGAVMSCRHMRWALFARTPQPGPATGAEACSAARERDELSHCGPTITCPSTATDRLVIGLFRCDELHIDRTDTGTWVQVGDMGFGDEWTSPARRKPQ